MPSYQACSHHAWKNKTCQSFNLLSQNLTFYMKLLHRTSLIFKFVCTWQKKKNTQIQVIFLEWQQKVYFHLWSSAAAGEAGKVGETRHRPAGVRGTLFPVGLVWGPSPRSRTSAPPSPLSCGPRRPLWEQKKHMKYAGTFHRVQRFSNREKNKIQIPQFHQLIKNKWHKSKKGKEEPNWKKSGKFFKVEMWPKE